MLEIERLQPMMVSLEKSSLDDVLEMMSAVDMLTTQWKMKPTTDPTPHCHYQEQDEAVN